MLINIDARIVGLATSLVSSITLPGADRIAHDRSVRPRSIQPTKII